MDAALHPVEGLLLGGIGDQIAQEAAAFIAVYWRIQARGGEGLAQQAIKLFDRHGHGLGDLLAAGHGAELVGKVEAHLANGGEALAEMHRQSNRARLASDRSGHALANPPEGIGRKLITTGGIKFLNSPLQSQ